jgi:hypothetical protein
MPSTRSRRASAVAAPSWHGGLGVVPDWRAWRRNSRRPALRAFLCRSASRASGPGDHGNHLRRGAPGRGPAKRHE